MNDKLDSLKPEHGKHVKLFKNEKNKHVIMNINDTSFKLQMALIKLALGSMDGTDYVTFICHQCLKDTALVAKDLATALEELVEKVS